MTLQPLGQSCTEPILANQQSVPAVRSLMAGTVRHSADDSRAWATKVSSVQNATEHAELTLNAARGCVPHAAHKLEGYAFTHRHAIQHWGPRIQMSPRLPADSGTSRAK